MYVYYICKWYKAWKDKEYAGWQYASIVSQKDLNKLERWAKPDKIEFNKDKCKVSATTRTRKEPCSSSKAEGAVA